MTWLWITLLSYILLALTNVGSKFLVSGGVLRPKTYVFYVGVLGSLIILLLPFVGFSFPELKELGSAIASGIFFSGALYWYYLALARFEASSVAAAIGGLTPVCVFFLVLAAFPGTASFSLAIAFALALLVGGSVLVSIEKETILGTKITPLSASSAAFFALSFVAAKISYAGNMPFWSVLIAMRLGGLLVSLALLALSAEVRGDVFARKMNHSASAVPAPLWRRVWMFALFLGNEGTGAAANILQQFALSIVPVSLVAAIYALQGVQYLALFGFMIMLSFLVPRILKERFSRELFMRKLMAILLIGGGLAIITFAGAR